MTAHAPLQIFDTPPSAPVKAVRFSRYAPGLNIGADARPSLDIARVETSDSPLITYVPISPRSEAPSQSPSPTWGLFRASTPREYDAEKGTASYFDAGPVERSGSRWRTSQRTRLRRLAVVAVALTLVVALRAGAYAFACVLKCCLAADMSGLQTPTGMRSIASPRTGGSR